MLPEQGEITDVMTLLNLLREYNWNFKLVAARFAGNLLCLDCVHYFNGLYINHISLHQKYVCLCMYEHVSTIVQEVIWFLI